MIFNDNETIASADKITIENWLKEHTLNRIHFVEDYQPGAVLLHHKSLTDYSVRRDELKLIDNTIWVNSFNLILYKVKELPSWVNDIKIKSTFHDDIQVFFVECSIRRFSKWKKTYHNTFTLGNYW